MVTEIPKIQFRIFVRDFLGIGMYYLFWFILLRLPFVLVKEIKENPHEEFSILFNLALLVVIIILFCCLLRCLAKGVVQGKRFCSAIAGFCFLAPGCCLIFPRFTSGVCSFVSNWLIGIFLIIIASFFFFLSISPGQADSHGT